MNIIDAYRQEKEKTGEKLEEKKELEFFFLHEYSLSSHKNTLITTQMFGVYNAS